MPTLIRAQRGVTPIQKAAARVHRDNAHVADGAPQAPPESPQQSAVIDPADLSPPLQYQRERAYAMCMSLRVERWLAEHYAAAGMPLDEYPRALAVLTLLPIYVEATLKARIKFPRYFPAPDMPDDDGPDEPTYTESDALAAGLTIKPPKARREAANLPGCHGVINGEWCRRLRRYGEKYCPSCRRKELERIRREQA